MKIILIGGNGTVGKHIHEALLGKGTEVVRVGKTRGDFQVDMENPESIARLFKSIGGFDSLVVAAGDVAFAPLQSLTQDQWTKSLQSKLMGQIHLVHHSLPNIREGGSITLVSGVLSDHYIKAGVAATTVNRAIEGFVQAAACELPKGVRINVVSPALLEDSLATYGDFFPGFILVDGQKVGQAFKRSVFGVQTGQIFRVL